MCHTRTYKKTSPAIQTTATQRECVEGSSEAKIQFPHGAREGDISSCRISSSSSGKEGRRGRGGENGWLAHACHGFRCARASSLTAGTDALGQSDWRRGGESEKYRNEIRSLSTKPTLLMKTESNLNESNETVAGTVNITPRPTDQRAVPGQLAKMQTAVMIIMISTITGT